MTEHATGRQSIERALREPTRVRRLLEVVGVLTDAAAPTRIVVIGGLAVAYWTAHQDATDIDVAMPDTREIRDLVDALGFSRAVGKRHWAYGDADIALEAPTARIGPGEVIVEAETPSGRPLSVLSPADLLNWRLDEFVGTGHADVAAHMVALAHSPYFDEGQALRHASRRGLSPAMPLVTSMISRWAEDGPLESDALHELARRMHRECYRRKSDESSDHI